MRAILCQLFVLLEKSSNLFVILLVNGLYRLRRIGFYGNSFSDCIKQRLSSWKRREIYSNWYKWERKPKTSIRLFRYESFEYISYSGTFSESDNWYNSNLLLIIARYIHRNPNEPFVSHADDNFVFIYFLSVLAQLALASGNKHN